jgi:N-acyl-phosphatidylethanolamine-hydrolysing phospholipase D
MSRHPATRNPGALRHRPDCLSSADRHNVDRVRPLAFLGALVMACSSLAAHAGAPRDGDVFTNPAGSRPWPGPDVTLPFFARKAWMSLVGREGAAPRVPYDRTAMLENPSLTWIGHSTFLVRMDGVTFLTDPMFSERASPVSFAGPKRLVAPGVPLAELPPVDFVTLSHDHYDHTDLPSIRALARRGTRFVAGLGMADLVRAAGGAVVELDWGESVEIGPVRVHCVPAQHFSGRSLVGHGRRLWVGWVVEGPARRFYHAGDTGYFDGFRAVRERFGRIDVAALPIGAYDPPAIMRFVHLDPEEAVRAALDLEARHVVAMHWGTFDLTDEPLDEPPRRFRAAADAAGVGSDRTWVLAVGETRRW